jgi:hypothetical protein
LLFLIRGLGFTQPGWKEVLLLALESACFSFERREKKKANKPQSKKALAP